MGSRSLQLVRCTCTARVLATALLAFVVGGAGAEELTMLQVYERGITSLVGQQIAIRAELWWMDGWAIAGPAKPAELCPPDSVLAAMAMGPAIAFAEADSLVAESQIPGIHASAAYISVVSAEVTATCTCTECSRYYRGRQLERGRPYRLRGEFRTAEWMGEVDPNDSLFAAQSNRPVYWSQTFGFWLAELSELPEPSLVQSISWGHVKQGFAAWSTLWPAPRATRWSADCVPPASGAELPAPSPVPAARPAHAPTHQRCDGACSY
jgi:hypothetical protein